MIFQELLIYPKINKPKEFKKPVTSIFAEVRFLVKRLKATITLNKDIWDSIAIVVAIKLLHDDFEHVTLGLLGQEGEKGIDKIQSMLSSAKAKFVSKRAVRVTANLAHMSRNNSLKHSKAIATSEDKRFNCYKRGHFSRDCKFPDYCIGKKKNSNNSSNIRQDQENNSAKPQPQRANAATNIIDEDDSDLESFCSGKALMTTESSIISRTQLTWYLDSCASRYLTNNQSLFVGKIQPKTWDFTTVKGQVIRLEGVGMVRIALTNRVSIELEGVTLVPECKSNLISLGQLQDNKITYYDKDIHMLLTQGDLPIA